MKHNTMVFFCVWNIQPHILHKQLWILTQKPYFYSIKNICENFQLILLVHKKTASKNFYWIFGTEVEQRGGYASGLFALNNVYCSGLSTY